MEAASALDLNGQIDGFLLNLRAQGQTLAPRAPLHGFGPVDAATAKAVIARFPHYSPTPLVELPELARQLGVGRLLVKDERGGQFNLGSFKALGGAYAVRQLASGAAGPTPTFTAATASNHGRSVAAGAAMVGARSVIFVYDGVLEAQIDAIARHGAEIVHVPGFYEDALATCNERAAADGWVVVSHTSSPGYDESRGSSMQGYLVLMAEMSAQAPTPMSHTFVQAASVAWQAQSQPMCRMILRGSREMPAKNRYGADCASRL